MLFINPLLSQTFSKSLTNSLAEAKVKDSTTGIETVEPISGNYIIEAVKKDDNYFEITLKSGDDQNKKFALKPLSLELFQQKLQSSYKEIVQLEMDKTFSSFILDKTEASVLFAQLVTFERTEDQRPLVANITLQKKVPVLIWKGNGDGKLERTGNDKDELFYALVDDIKLEITFFEAYIEKIEAEFEVFDSQIYAHDCLTPIYESSYKGDKTKVRVTNTYSIGISSSNGIKNLSNHHLLSFNSYNYDGVHLKKGRGDESYLIELNLADLIDYDRVLSINGNDISPEKTKLVLDKTQTSAKLYKEASTKLFEAVVFSDFLGVFDEENPNGIIQTEISKKFFINTNRTGIKSGNRWIPFNWYSEAVGGFEYLDVTATLSKIEENEKFLDPTVIEDESFFEPINVRQNQSFSVGADMNLVYWENQNKKINTYLDIGLRYGRTGLNVGDQERFVNTVTPSAKISFQFISEDRYGFTASNRVSYFEILDKNNLNIQSIELEGPVSPNKYLNETSFDFFIDVGNSNTGKLFLRYSLISELEDFDTNFSQVQFGYSFYILKSNTRSN